MKRSLFIFFITCIHYCFLNAQENGINSVMDPEEMDDPKPRVSALPNVEDIPIDYYNGSISYHIPLFSIGDNIISQDLSLVYSGHALSMTEIPSWIGAGWDLKGVGTISREIRGNSDLAQRVWECYADDGCITEHYWAGNNYSNLPTSVDLSGNVTYADNSVSQIGNNNFDQFVAPPSNYKVSTGLDGEPDLFRFNFNGNSGFFLSNNSNQLVFSGPEHLQVLSTPSQDDGEWVIQASDGTKYTFGGVGYVDWNWVGSQSVKQVSTWYLKEIEALTGQKIVFTYKTDGLSYFPQLASDLTYTGVLGPGSGNPEPVTSDGHVLDKIVYYNSGNAPLREIELISTDDRLDASLDPSYTKRRLRKVILKHYVNGIPKKAGSFELTTENIPQKRLMLTSVEKLGVDPSQGDVSAGYVYSFEYHQKDLLPTLFRTYPPPVSLYGPAGFSDQRDFWDHHNGAVNPNTLVPEYNPDGSLLQVGGADRMPDPQKITYGMLKKITYPTGGSTEFNFEIHDFNDNGTIHQGGGARIKEIVTKAPEGDHTLSFDYTGVNGSSGKLITKSKFDYSSLYAINGVLEEKNVKRIASIIPASRGANGSYVGYGQVKVTYKGTDNSIQKTEKFTFHNEQDLYNYTQSSYQSVGFSPEIPNLPTIPDSRNGQLLTHEVYAYDNTSNTEVLRKSTQNTYQEIYSADIYGFRGEYPLRTNSIYRSMNFYYVPEGAVPTGQYGKLLRYSYYNVPIKWYVLQDQTKLEYRDNGNVGSTYTWSYYDETSPHHGSIKGRSFVNSQGDTITEHYAYSNDAANNIKKPSFLGIDKNGSFVWAKSVAYNTEGLPETYKEIRFDPSLAGTVQSVLSQMDNSTIRAQLSFDENGNVQEFTGRDGIAECYLWGNGGLNLVASIQNATYADIVSVLGASEIQLIKGTTLSNQQMEDRIETLRLNLPNAIVRAISYDDSGRVVAMLKDQNGVEQTFEYDEFYRLNRLKDDDGNILGLYDYNLKGQ